MKTDIGSSDVIRSLAMAVLVALTAMGNGAVMAMDAKTYTAGPISVSHTWARVILASRPGAAYLQISNDGHHDDRLVSASSPNAERVELHTHIMENDVAHMRPVDSVDVPAGGGAEFAPGSNHIMLFGLTGDVSEGDVIPLTLQFENAGSIDIEAMIMRAAPEASDMSGHGDHGGDAGDHGSHDDGAHSDHSGQSE